MRISSFFYTIGQGFKNLGRNKWYTLASIATISACLFLFGLFYSIIGNFTNIVKTAEEGVSVTVFFKEGTSEDQILAVKSDLEKRAEDQIYLCIAESEGKDSDKSEIIKKETGIVFSKVLEHAGVYKCNEEGLNAFERFVAVL